MKFYLLVTIVLLTPSIFISCRNRDSDDLQKQSAVISSEDTSKKDDQLVMALLYQQRAAEYRALCIQCYNTARERVDEAIKNTKLYKNNLPFAVVTDLDETALDNSENEAWLYLNDSSYTQKEFDRWSICGKAGSVPGSVSFFNYVNSLKDKRGRKISIYYISNRTDSIPVKDSTMSQMQQLGFPQIIDSQFLFKGRDSASSKEFRRQMVLRSHNIILLLGDNLIDLNAAFDKTSSIPQERLRRVDSLFNTWGNKYIVFPNAEYGDWESALYPNGKYDSLIKEKKWRVQSLKPRANW